MVAVILAHDSLASLKRVLDAVRAQTWRPVEMIIVDNGSRDGTADYCRRFARDCTLALLPGNRGIGAGHNLGWRRALGNPACEFIWALEHDTIPDPDCLETLVRAYRAHAVDHRIGAVCPVQAPTSTASPESRYVLAGLRVRRVARVQRSGPPTIVRGLTFNGCLLPREALTRVGPLNEEFFIGHEDLDFAASLVAAGFSVLKVPSAFVLHDAYRNHRPVHLLGRTILLPGADVERTYYFNRNALYREVLRGRRRGGLTLASIPRLAAALVYSLVVRDQKLRRAAALVTATRDGLRGRLGERRYWFLRWPKRLRQDTS